VLPETLAAYRDGDRAAQVALLDEVEPLLFGYVRSLTPTGPDAFERAVSATHELVLGFHLRALLGTVEIADANALRAASHAMAVTKLGAENVGLADLADEETGSLVHRAAAVGDRIRAELDDTETALLAARLCGEAAPGDWDGVRERMRAAGVIAG
jgi:hypothetical protein